MFPQARVHVVAARLPARSALWWPLACVACFSLGFLAGRSSTTAAVSLRALSPLKEAPGQRRPRSFVPQLPSPVLNIPPGDFCAVPPTSTRYVDESVPGFSDVSSWNAERLATLESIVCVKATQEARRFIHVQPVQICVYDPAVDKVISGPLVKWRWWGSYDAYLFMLSGGYAAGGVPLTFSDSEAMRTRARAAAAAGTPYSDVWSLVAELQLPPVTAAEKVHAMCSRERPFLLDIGANIGVFSGLAAASGCWVIMVEPLTQNVGRLWQSAALNGWQDRMTLYKNAVARDRRLLKLTLISSNPGSSKVTQTHVEGTLAKADGTETVSSVLLDDLFDGGPTRPRHPFLDRPIQPKDVAQIKVDVESYEMAAVWGLRRTIEEGLPPLWRMEFQLGDDRGLGCSNLEFFRWAYALGYEAFGLGQKRRLTLSDWETLVLPGLASSDGIKALWDEHRIPPFKELYFVHSSSKAPRVFLEAVGEDGALPV